MAYQYHQTGPRARNPVKPEQAISFNYLSYFNCSHQLIYAMLRERSQSFLGLQVAYEDDILLLG